MLFADDMLFIQKTLKCPPKNTVRTKKWISKFSGYKVNTQKPIASLYINNELSERENLPEEWSTYE